MADEIDLANTQAARWLTQSLAVRREAHALAPTGSCHNCELTFDATDPNSQKKLFCDSECAAEFEEEKKRQSRR